MNDQQLPGWLEQYKSDTVEVVLSQIENTGEIDNFVSLVLFDEMLGKIEIRTIEADQIDNQDTLGFYPALNEYVKDQIRGDLMLVCLTVIARIDVTSGKLAASEQEGLGVYFETAHDEDLHAYAIVDTGVQVNLCGDLMEKIRLMPAVNEIRLNRGARLLDIPGVFKLF